jgi:hypothetical protein
MSNEVLFPGITVIHHTGARQDREETRAKMREHAEEIQLTLNLRPPEFMAMAFIMMCGGSEELILASKDPRELVAAILHHQWDNHPRLRWMKMVEPDGTVLIDTREHAPEHQSFNSYLERIGGQVSFPNTQDRG